MTHIPHSASSDETAPLIHWRSAVQCCDEKWEDAYVRFETPAEEIAKFKKRFRQLGADDWPRSVSILDIFCGRGNGLRALAELGFTDLEGVDLSAELLQQYSGPAQLYVGDCREMQLDDESRDVVVVQGGLHHLLSLPEDLQRVLAECNRILKPGGRIVIVEPWLTPFLSFVHLACRQRWIKKIWPKLDALAIMIEREQETYFRWLSQPAVVLGAITHLFDVEQQVVGWGKLMLVGRKQQKHQATVSP